MNDGKHGGGPHGGLYMDPAIAAAAGRGGHKTNFTHATIITGEKQIRCVRTVAAIQALKLEKVGIRVRRGPKVSTQFRRELGLKRSATLDDMIAKLQAQLSELHAELGIVS